MRNGIASTAEGEEQLKKSVSRVQLLALAVISLIAIAGVVAGYNSMRAAWLREDAATNLKLMGIAFYMYAGEVGRGRYPAPVRTDGGLAPDLQLLYPRFISDPVVFINPRLRDASEQANKFRRALEATPPDWGTAHETVAKGYTYLPWAIADASDLSLFVEKYPELDDAMLDADIEVLGIPGTIYRLRRGVERFDITDIMNPAGSIPTQASIPVMFEVVTGPEDARGKLGCNVLFMDGHVEFIRYGERFPVVPEMAALFGGTR